MIGYQYKVREVEGRPVIAIKCDNDSIIGSIDQILDEISNAENLNPVEYYIVFAGPNNIWNGYELATKMVVTVNGKSWKECCIKLINERR